MAASLASGDTLPHPGGLLPHPGAILPHPGGLLPQPRRPHPPGPPNAHGFGAPLHHPGEI
uniref:Uncharacterized protein n=1 Tax=Saccharum spontaneum TaxID=62335 RepID=A0A678TH31_SACSP|nr:hypothetical protein SS06L04_000007 [Saccharum spontaneum]